MIKIAGRILIARTMVEINELRILDRIGPARADIIGTLTGGKVILEGDYR